MTVVNNERPPYVEFEYVAVEDRAETQKQGRFVAKDVPFVTVVRPGDKDALVIEAETWLNNLRQKAKGDLVPPTWVTHFEAKFEAWKKGEQLPVSGTPVKTWPVISPAEARNLIKAGYLTVEDVAGAPDSQMMTFGLGGIALKQKAQTWLKSAQDTGKVTEQITDLSQKLSEALEVIKKQSTLIAELQAAQKAK